MEESEDMSVLLNFIWLVVAILVVFALAGEWKAVTSNTINSKNAIDNAIRQPVGSAGYCNTVAYATQLSQSQLILDSFQWRRGLIASSILTIVAPAFLGKDLNKKPALILLTVTWVVFTGMVGYADYHLNVVANSAANDILKLAISRFDPATCDPALINTLS